MKPPINHDIIDILNSLQQKILEIDNNINKFEILLELIKTNIVHQKFNYYPFKKELRYKNAILDYLILYSSYDPLHCIHNSLLCIENIISLYSCKNESLDIIDEIEWANDLTKIDLHYYLIKSNVYYTLIAPKSMIEETYNNEIIITTDPNKIIKHIQKNINIEQYKLNPLIATLDKVYQYVNKGDLSN